MRSVLDFVASGKRYTPSCVAHPFFSSHDFGAIKDRGKNSGSKYEFGSSTLRIEQGAWPAQWSALIETAESLVPRMKEAGAEHFQVQFIVLNAEGVVLSVASEHLRFLAAHDCDIRMSYGTQKEPNQAPEPTAPSGRGSS